jgi:hypothetical protein
MGAAFFIADVHNNPAKVYSRKYIGYIANTRNKHDYIEVFIFWFFSILNT